MTTYYEIIRSDRDGKWSIRKSRQNRKMVKDTFEYFRDAEKWIEKYHRDKNDSFWFDHVIKKHSGHLMTLEQWKEDCDMHFFIDYDGAGDLVDQNFEIIGHTYPSEYTDKNRDYSLDVKYVLWYNR
jgi:hypothetical protein